LASITQKRLNLHKLLQEKLQYSNALESQLQQLQHLANVGTISYMIAHEINNLLTPLRSYADLALKNKDDQALTEKALQKTMQNCERITKITESMLTLANGQTQQKQQVQLRELVEQIFECLCRDFAKDSITVNIDIADDITVCVIPVQIQQVIMNLILNARDAMLPKGGILTIKAVQNHDSVEIEITDTGQGIEPAALKHIFESFFTTRKRHASADSNSGTGLGLAFCKKVIDVHDGSISVESQPLCGTKFRITLPKTGEQGTNGRNLIP
jgi:two-component system, NtrC family, sensor kinase